MKWHDAGCSQDKEDHAWKVIQKNDTLVVEYITTWKGIRYKNRQKIYFHEKNPNRTLTRRIHSQTSKNDPHLFFKLISIQDFTKNSEIKF